MTITPAAYEFSRSISTTEWSLVTDSSGPDASTDVGMFQAYVDLNAMAAGDEFELKIYEKVASSGGTQRLITTERFAGARAQPIWVSPTLVLAIGWDITLKRIAGSDRTIVWRIAKVA